MMKFLLLGFLVGLRHSLEADHVAAVAALATGQKAWRRTVLQGAAWGLGHGVTLLAVGAVCLWFGLGIPQRFALLLEGAVGLMLVWLGWDVLRRLAPRAGLEPGIRARKGAWRAIGVGMVHGLAGSAALLLLVASTLRSPLVGILYIACFSVGGVLGIAALSVVISLPLRGTALKLTWGQSTLQALTGLSAIGIGAWILYAAGAGAVP